MAMDDNYSPGKGWGSLFIQLKLEMFYVSKITENTHEALNQILTSILGYTFLAVRLDGWPGNG